MKKIFKTLKLSHLLFLSIVSLFIACDIDFKSIESDVLGEDNFNLRGNVNSDYTVVAYNQTIRGQRINGLTRNLLGFYNDPIYGQTTASIITQLFPSGFNPTFGTNAKIDSVKLTIPYLSTNLGFTDLGVPQYRLNFFYLEDNDTVNINPIKLTVYENRYFLRDFGLNSSDTQNYFSLADGSINGTDNFAITQDNTINFDDQVGHKFFEGVVKPSNKPREEITVIDSVTNNTSFFKPAIEVELAETDVEKGFWKELVLDQEGLSTFSNNNNFQNHFRGIYIKSEAVNNLGSMFLLNLADEEARIIVYFSFDGEEEDVRESSLYTFGLRGTNINTFINNFNTIIPQNPNTSDGDEKLYLKGTEGALAVIELFNDGETQKINCNCRKDSQGNDIKVNVTEFDCFKKTFRKTDDEGNVLDPINGRYELKQLINEAHLSIYEDESFASNANNPDFIDYERLFLYDLENNTPIPDYFSDPTADENSLSSRLFSLGKTTNENGFSKYKIKVTDYLNNILIRDADNVKLGLTISNNINETFNIPLFLDSGPVSNVPINLITSPRGKVLYGSNTTSEKKMKLNIFYTGSR